MRTARIGLGGRWTVAGVWVYLTILLGWSGLYFATGDRFSYLALVNTLAVYLFVPLPLAIALAPFLRRWEIWLGTGLGILIFASLWGDLFFPRTRIQPSNNLSLTVMTYNVLGNHAIPDPIVEVIEFEDPDVVFIQELNPLLAGAVQRELSRAYPYQLLDPVPGVAGMGLISKFPLTPLEASLGLEWVGTPQLAQLEWEVAPVILVNFHMYPSGLGTPAAVNAVYRAREDQARALATFAARVRDQAPLLVAGDANVTDLSQAYDIMAAELIDTWREAGIGLGHTFPGSAIPGSSRPRIAGFPVPPWLARIDYIFHSPDWVTMSVRRAAFDGVSDHRGVVATLVLR